MKTVERFFRQGSPWALGLLAAVSVGCGGDDTGSAGPTLAAHCLPGAMLGTYRADAAGPTGTAAGEATGLSPCYQLTGLGSAENTLAIDAEGTVYMAPAFTEAGVGLMRSSDLGATWEVRIPGQHGGYEHDKPQPYMFMDPTTERLFYTNPGEGGYVMSFSDDGGDTFKKTTLMEGTIDWIKVAIGPLPDGSQNNAMYAMAPAPISTPSPFTTPDFQRVERSLDGGETWTQVGGEMLSIVASENGCPGDEWVIYGGGAVASDGTVYFGLRRCQRVGVAVSRDSGETWDVRDVPGSEVPAYGGLTSHLTEPNLLVPEPLAIDGQDNLFALWVDGAGALRMAVSRDGAETFGDPVAVAAPEAPFAVYPAATFNADGHMALAYYGSPDAIAYHAYVAESLDPLADAPTFVSVRLNDEAKPLHADGFDVGYATVLSGGDLVEIVQVRYAPNGDIWAAFSADMCPGTAANDACGDWDPAAHLDARFQGAIARIAHGGK